MLAAVDLGGTNTDILLTADDGAVERAVVLPWAAVFDVDGLVEVLKRAGVAVEELAGVAVTGGRHRELPEELYGVPLLHVDELRAIGGGGLAAAGVERAMVMSMGTGTAFVSAGPEGYRHHGGTAVGGGTVLGLARLLLGTTDYARIGELAAAGDPRAVDLSVGDIIGAGVGVVPPELTAAHFGRVGHPATDPDAVQPADIAAGLMELVGQALGRMGLLAARAAGHDQVVLTGHLVEWPGIRLAMGRVSGAFGGRIIVPPDPGFATARGVLLELVAERGGLRAVTGL